MSTPLPTFVIAGFYHADLLLGLMGQEVSHVISINHPGEPPPSNLQGHEGEHLVLFFDDIAYAYEGCVEPTKDHVRQILDFGATLDESSHVLVHCMAGISRSSASVLCILASRFEPSLENAEKVMRLLQDIKQDIRPNALMVRHADELLGYGGELIAAHRFVWQDAYLR